MLYTNFFSRQHVGCDWEIESSAVEDRCGVCYGDGSTCTTVKHKFTETIDDGTLSIPRVALNPKLYCTKNSLRTSFAASTTL